MAEIVAVNYSVRNSGGARPAVEVPPWRCQRPASCAQALLHATRGESAVYTLPIRWWRLESLGQVRVRGTAQGRSHAQAHNPKRLLSLHQEAVQGRASTILSRAKLDIARASMVPVTYSFDRAKLDIAG